MSDEHVGTLARLTCNQLAERAADELMTRRTPYAVCMSPEGAVTLERPHEAVIDDIVGVFDRKLGLIPLYREIRDNLAAEIEARGGVEAILARRKERRRAA